MQMLLIGQNHVTWPTGCNALYIVGQKVPCHQQPVWYACAIIALFLTVSKWMYCIDSVCMFCNALQFSVLASCCYGLRLSDSGRGCTAAAAPPPFRLGKPFLCGSHPLVTPYYCRLGIVCVICMCLCLLFCCVLCCLLFLCVLYFCGSFPSVLWYCWLGLLTCKTVSQITCTVLVETLNTNQLSNSNKETTWNVDL